MSSLRNPISAPAGLKSSRLLLAVAAVLVSGGALAANYTKTETIEYHDDAALWVLGQVKRTTTDGVETSRTDFGWMALPWKTYSFGRTTPNQTFAYDSTSAISTGQRGTLTSVTDALSHTTTFSSWMRGIPQSILYADATSQSALVNGNGWIDSVTNEVGAKTCYGYDEMGRLASIKHPSETQSGVCDTSVWAETISSFDPVANSEYGIAAGHWKQTVSTGNARQITYFDAMWRPLVEERYDAGNVAATKSVSVKRYDAAGRLEFQSYPRGSISNFADAGLLGTKTTYDALDRQLTVAQDSELGALTTAYAYLSGPDGPYTRITDPRTYQTRIWHQAFDQPSTEHPVEIRAPEGAYTLIQRDVFGKPITMTRQNAAGTIAATRRYYYDSYQRLCRTMEPETKSTVMDYDAADNLIWSSPGMTLTAATSCYRTQGSTSLTRSDREYDARNRITLLTYRDAASNVYDTVYDYHDDGLLHTISAVSGSTVVTNTYTYNQRRLPTKEEMDWNTIAWDVDTSYNANGHVLSQTYPGNLTVTYAPNALGQPTQAGSYATGVSYFPNGGIKQFTYGNGIVHTLTQNTRQLPDRSLDAYGTERFLDDGYDYDANGNVAAITDGSTLHPGAMNRDMTYDQLNRLKTVLSPMYNNNYASYDYDVLDNLTRVKIYGQTARDHYYCYDSNWQLTNIKTGGCTTGASVVGLGYDDQGNFNARNQVDYVFDYGNRLRQITDGSQVSTYVYDGHGRRVRDLTGESRYSFYSQSGQLAFTSDSRADKYTNYIYLGGSLVATREWAHGTTSPFTVKYQHTDALGSPILVTDAARGTVGLPSHYEPYGQVVNQPVKDGPGYTGHVTDAATGLVYAQQRYYDPMIGRFLSVDPVTADDATGANFNRYWYAANNPYKFTDPDGRYWCNGGPQACAQIDQFVGTMRSGLNNMDPGSAAFRRMSDISESIGEPWQENGVTFTPEAVEGDAYGSAGPGGAISVDIDQIGEIASRLQSSNPEMSAGQLINVVGADVIAHEGSHNLDASGGQGMPRTREASYRTESSAYRIQSALDRALGVNTGLNWTGMTEAERQSQINDGANASTDSWCEGNSACK